MVEEGAPAAVVAPAEIADVGVVDAVVMLAGADAEPLSNPRSVSASLAASALRR